MTRYQMIQKMFPSMSACAFYEERCETLTHSEISYAYSVWKVNHCSAIAILDTMIEQAKGEHRTVRPYCHH